MNLFGTVLELNADFKTEPLDQRLVEDIVKRDKERGAFIGFLRTKSDSGQSVFEKIVHRAEMGANLDIENGLLISQGLLFQLAGVSFFTLYGLSVIAYIKIAARWPARLFGVCVLLLVAGVTLTFGLLMIYPLILLALGWGWVLLARRPQAVELPETAQ